MKRIGKVLVVIVLSICVLSVAVITMASAAIENNISVLLNGQPIEFDQSPIIENERTLVPMRAIFEALGADVAWDEETQTVFATRGNDFFALQIGNTIAYYNDIVITMDVAPVLVNQRTLVPVRVIAESFGATVDWDAENQSVIIEDDSISTPIIQIEMQDGKTITIELYPQYAPKTVANFLELIEKEFYNGLAFHRIISDL